jgi:hypothetical protein
MENPRFVFQGKYTADDYVRANFVHLKRAVIVVAVLTCTFLLTWLMEPDLVWGGSLFGVSMLLTPILLAVLLVLWLVVTPMRIRRFWKQSPKLHGTATLTFGDEGMEVSTEDGFMRFGWSEFKKYRQDEKDHFFELLGPKGAYRFLPKHFVEQSGNEGAFPAFVSQRLGGGAIGEPDADDAIREDVTR